MHYSATKRGDDILDKLVWEHTCTRSTRHWPLTLFLNLTGIACVVAFVLWMLKNPNWQTKKNNQRRPYVPSLGEEMVTPHISIRVNSGNVDRHTRKVMKTTGVT